MTARPSANITAILRRWSNGDTGAADELMDAVYADLRRLARQRLRGERANHTLQPTAMVNELFLVLRQQRRISWQSRNQFLALSCHLMKRLLLDHARRRHAQKRHATYVTLDDGDAVQDPVTVDALQLSQALEKLAASHPREARVVELRYFAGFTAEEVAAQLGVAPVTVKRDWRFARSWLLAELAEPPGGAS